MGQKSENFEALTVDVQKRRLQVRKFLQESCELAKALPPRKRMLFLMRYDSGFSNKDIADLCHSTEETVQRRLKEISNELDLMRDSVRSDPPRSGSDGDGGG